MSAEENMSDKPLCINCARHHDKTGDKSLDLMDTEHWCKHGFSVVTGETNWIPCYANRSERYQDIIAYREEVYDTCGIDGKYFIKKGE